MVKKILVSSFAVSPLLGSEPGLGWNFCSRIGCYYNVTVLFGFEKNTFARDYSIENHLSQLGLNNNVKFVWVEASALAKFLYKLHTKTGYSFLYYMAYNLWQRSAYKKALEFDALENFDLVHQFNMIGFREPGYLWKLPKPYLWGPVGGTVNIDSRFFKLFGYKGILANLIRNSANKIQLKFSRKVKLAGINSNLIIAASTSEKNNLINVFPNKKIVVINDAGISSINHVIDRDYGKKFKIIWSGTHTPGKALPILLRALSLCRDEVDFELTVLGKGSETDRWKKLARNLEIENKIIWTGWIEREKALEHMAKAHVTVFTSLKEGTPHVVLESLSLGLPVITLDKCGMGDVIDETCGIKIKVGAIDEIVLGFSNAIKTLYTSPDKIEVLSKGALRRADEYKWDNFVFKFSEIYKEIIENK